MTKKDIILWQEKLSLKGILALLVFSVIIPLKHPNDDLKFLVSLSSNIGIALFTTLSVSKYLQKEAKDLVFDGIPLLQIANTIGIASFPKNGSIEVLDFKESNFFTIVMNDGKSFISQNASQLCARFEQDGKTTTFILLDAESEAAKLLCRANGKVDVNTYKNKIIQAIKEIKDYSERYPKHNFEIYAYPEGYFRISIILTDTQALIGTYRNSPGKRKIPLHILISKYGDEFSAIKEDVKQLKNLSERV